MRFFKLIAFLLLVSLSVSAHDRSLDEMKSSAVNILNAYRTSSHRAKALSMDEVTELKRMERLSIIGNKDIGFAVISHDDRFSAVLGYSFAPLQDSLPCGFRWWLSSINESLNKQIHSSNSYQETVTKKSYPRSVAPMITTKWGQGTPYNNKLIYRINGNTVQFVAGCVATAMAQVMNYHQYPDKGKDSISYIVWNYKVRMNHSFEDSYYDWDLMADEYDLSNSFGGSAEAVSILVRDCGMAVSTNYGPTSSGSNSKRIAPALIEYFSYDAETQYYERSNYTDSQWMDLIYKELSSKRPIIYNGLDKRDTSNTFGHSFVLHGYDSQGLIYINWGWKGNYDGYYNLSYLSLDGNNMYNDEQDMVFAVPGNISKVDPASCKLRITAEGNGVVCWNMKPDNYERRTTKSFRVDKGKNVKLILSPESGYKIEKVTSNGVDVTSQVWKVSETEYEYSINKMTTDVDIVVAFVKDLPSKYTVTVWNKGYGGDVWINGIPVSYKKDIEVAPGSDVELKMSPHDYMIHSYVIETVTVNGVDVTSEIVDDKYTIKNIQQDTEIEVVFAEKQNSDWLLTIDVEGGGEVVYNQNHIREGSEKFNVKYNILGTNVWLNVIPDEGCSLDSVLIIHNDKIEDETWRFLYDGLGTIRMSDDTRINVRFSENKVGIDDAYANSTMLFHSTPKGVIIDNIGVGEIVYVYSTEGKLLQTVKVASNQMEIPLKCGRAYIFKIRGKIVKYVL